MDFPNGFPPFAIFYLVLTAIAIIFLALILYFTYLLFFSWLAMKIVNDLLPFFMDRNAEIQQYLPK